jgi:predicted amidohydrolase YtcJ
MRVSPDSVSRYLAGFLFLLLAVVCCSPTGPRANLVLRGGRVYTSNPERPWAEALAIVGETIRAVGSNTDMDHFIDRDTVVVELDGRLVLPGFSDCHVDFLRGSLDLDKVQLDEAHSIRDVQDLVLAHARNHPDLQWICGTGWIFSKMSAGSSPQRHHLDEVVSDRPVLLETNDRKSLWVNSKALQLAGIDRYAQPEGPGTIVRSPDTGEPTGLLHGEGATSRVRRILPQPSKKECLQALRRGIAYAHRFGITSIHTDVGSVAESHYMLFEELEQRSELTVRVYTIFAVTKETADSDLDRIERLRDLHSGPWLESGAARIELDGEVESQTAAMIEPYRDVSSSTGETNFDQDELNLLVGKLDRRGIPVVIRARGDRAVRMALDAYETISNSGSRNPLRYRIEGVDVISHADIPRFPRLGLIASIRPFAISPDFVSNWRRYLGPARLTRAFALNSLETSGAVLVFGSGWPELNLGPVLGIHTAVTRENLDGKPERGWNPDERLSLEEAIAAYTLGGAFCSHSEAVRGTVREGKLADLVVLSEDLFRIPRRRIAEIEAVLTLVGGRPVYASPIFFPRDTRDLLLDGHGR